MLGFATTCGSLVRRRALVRASPLARCLSSAEGGADVAKVTPGGFGTTYARPSTAAESKQKKWTNTVTPWHARALCPRGASRTAADTVTSGQLAGIPPAMLKRKVRIYRRTRQATTSSSDKTKAWKIEFNHQRELPIPPPPPLSLPPPPRPIQASLSRPCPVPVFSSREGAPSARASLFRKNADVLNALKTFLYDRPLEQPSHGMAVQWGRYGPAVQSLL